MDAGWPPGGPRQKWDGVILMPTSEPIFHLLLISFLDCYIKIKTGAAKGLQRVRFVCPQACRGRLSVTAPHSPASWDSAERERWEQRGKRVLVLRL